MYDLQKANVWKRISAALFDVIMLGVVIVGAALLLSIAFNYDSYVEQKNEIENFYCEKHGFDRNLTDEQKSQMTEEQQKAYDEKYNAVNEDLRKDETLKDVLGKLFDFAFLIITLSVLMAFLLWEFLVPLLMKNGQTLGKKVFGVAVMRYDGVKLQPLLLFVRTILGKCVLGTLIPVYGCILIFFNAAPLLGLVVTVLPLVAQLILFLATRNHTPLHDLLAQTVAVDMASQLIFDSPEALLEYKKRIHAEEAEKRER